MLIETCFLRRNIMEGDYAAGTTENHHQSTEGKKREGKRISKADNDDGDCEEEAK